MATLQFTVHRPNGELLAAFRHPEDAALFIGTQGDQHEIRCDARVVWVQGKENFRADDASCSDVANIILSRIGEGP